ncbi:inner membrane complex protein 1l, putative [Plasmodium berghei]|uniref:Inner membrane complex protein 1l, putative n=2 Tax=Plasmodium berghei TaxID=5821 RepID=A0A509AKY8_PLABA|nr:inner membrane complex protein 1l, putative [Plasmodium berghei ANKA]CXI54118.1 inner membrane complex protein 1l, putative [Plasmodium berghei]SCL94912.1 inner membrane complex protein 1l, putative [Plasmodium berghei]SCM16132.1 inner membrane complex protein 1l, putative [Plasmodium berghei]SCM17928.1 inner membrane complex protein 1l, putative [Plasmodium berghei]SCN26284.1 inner membrane complex protein 1l, putative [Plasmodium berghei]|eukprot:XP_034422056.1 inner membrane complex protein 1l, putative [Plasmodium berghei ANKA]
MGYNYDREGLKPCPINAYSFNAYDNHFKYPIYRRNVGEIIYSNSALRNRQTKFSHFCKAPRYKLKRIERKNKIPVFHKAPKIVEVPEIREITRFVDNVKIVDIPIEQIRIIPKIKIRDVEKIRHVPGPIEYIDIEQERIVHKPYIKLIEKIREIPEIEDVNVEVPVYVPTPVGPPEDIYINVPLPYDVPQFCYKPDQNIINPISHPIAYNINHDPNIYINEGIINSDFQDIDHKKTYSVYPEKDDSRNNEADECDRNCKKECDVPNNNIYDFDVYKNNIHDNFNVSEEIQNYSKYKNKDIPKEKQSYSKYLRNYECHKNIKNNEYNTNAENPFDKYYYSYSNHNDYKNENYENNKNYIYDNEQLFPNYNSNNNSVAELIVKKNK